MLHKEPGYMSADPFFVATIRIRKTSESRETAVFGPDKPERP